MRLLNTRTIKLEEFEGDEIPLYAILSHTWETEEVSYEDMMSDRYEHLAGYQKIKGMCDYAASESWSYVWIDTCGIDKRSSAELSEAINSMFQWYKKAAVCYAYMFDVEDEMEPPKHLASAFRNSRWFTRGWTLQELLAPEEVIFLSKNWKEIGSKRSLNKLICHITGISDLSFYMGASVAQKFSWISTRRTKRVEDMAYCLLGLFDINMPLLYGEGENSFIRLQHEILARTNDESIFAWSRPHFSLSYLRFPVDHRWLLAPTPSFFEGSGNIERHEYVKRRPWTMTNMGLEIELPFIESRGIFNTQINCKRIRASEGLSLRLRQMTNGRYERIALDERTPRSADAEAKWTNVIIEQPEYRESPYYRLYKVEILLHQKLEREKVVQSGTTLTFDNLLLASDSLQVPTSTSIGPTTAQKNSCYVLGDTTFENDDCVALMFEKKISTLPFAVIFGCNASGAWVDIIPELISAKIKTRLRSAQLNTYYRTDRISKLVSPTMSITATIRKRSSSIVADYETNSRSPPFYYELLIEPGTERLRWPRLREDDLAGPEDDDSADNVSISNLSISSLKAEHGDEFSRRRGSFRN